MTTKKRLQSETNKSLELCDYQCVICGWNKKNLKGESLLQGAHIKPFENIDNDTYTDIVAMCPNCHIEFDNSLFYISNDGKDKVYKKNGKIAKNKLFKNVGYVNKEFLAYRQYIYNSENK